MTAGFIVFAGPSLPAREATTPFDFRPPAEQGDVFLAVEAGARAIGLVDGLFEGSPSVWHKEILFALSRGVHVLGAASMGALRAAELHVHGMRGVGRIFEWYVSGAIDADDEVALVHAPAELGHAPLTVPLVNVRATLEAARSAGAIDAAAANAVMDAARRIHFKERGWKAVVEAAGLTADGTVARALTINAVDQKQADARRLLDAMAALAADWPGPHRPGFTFEETDAWEAGVAAFRAREALSEFDRLVLDEARLGGPRFVANAARAAASLLAAEAGHPPPAGRGRRVDRFRGERGLTDSEAFRQWLARARLDTRALGAILDARAAAAALVDRRPDTLAAAMVAELKLDGSYHDLARRAEDKARRRAATAGAPRPPRQLQLEWYFEQRLGRSCPADIDEARRDLALPDVEALFKLIEREYLASGLPNQE